LSWHKAETHHNETTSRRVTGTPNIAEIDRQTDRQTDRWTKVIPNIKENQFLDRNSSQNNKIHKTTSCTDIHHYIQQAR